MSLSAEIFVDFDLKRNRTSSEQTCVRYEVRVIPPGVDPVLLQQGVVLVCSSHKLGLLSAGLGTPGSQHQAYQDDHQDQDGDDGQEYPDQGSHFDSLKLIMFSLVLHFCYSLENFYTISLFLKKIMWKLSSSASEFRHKVSCLLLELHS